MDIQTEFFIDGAWVKPQQRNSMPPMPPMAMLAVGDRKCLGDQGELFIEHLGAILYHD